MKEEKQGGRKGKKWGRRKRGIYACSRQEKDQLLFDRQLSIGALRDVHIILDAFYSHHLSILQWKDAASLPATFFLEPYPSPPLASSALSQRSGSEWILLPLSYAHQRPCTMKKVMKLNIPTRLPSSAPSLVHKLCQFAAISFLCLSLSRFAQCMLPPSPTCYLDQASLSPSSSTGLCELHRED